MYHHIVVVKIVCCEIGQNFTYSFALIWSFYSGFNRHLISNRIKLMLIDW